MTIPEGKSSFSTNLNTELLTKLKIQAIKEGRKVNDILEELISKYMDEKESK